jgi:hypothetical protein
MKISTSLQIILFFVIVPLYFQVGEAYAQNVQVTIKAVRVYSTQNADNENEDYRFRFWYNNAEPANCLGVGGTYNNWLSVNYTVAFNRTIDLNGDITLEVNAWEEDGCRGNCSYDNTALGCDDNLNCGRNTGVITSAPAGVPTGGTSFKLYNFAPGNVNANLITIDYCGGNYRVEYLVTYTMPQPTRPVISLSGAIFNPDEPTRVCNNPSVTLTTTTSLKPEFDTGVTLTWYYNVNAKKKTIYVPNPEYCGGSAVCEGGGPVLQAQSFQEQAESESVSAFAPIIDPGGELPPCCSVPAFLPVEELDWSILGTSTRARPETFNLRDIAEIRNYSTENGDVQFSVVATSNGSASASSNGSGSLPFKPLPPYISNTTTDIVTASSCKNGADGSIQINNITGYTNNYRVYVIRDPEDQGPSVSFVGSSVTVGGLAPGLYTVQLANGGGDIGNCNNIYTTISTSPYQRIQVAAFSSTVVSGSLGQHITCYNASDGRINVTATGGRPGAEIAFTLNPATGSFVRTSSHAGYFQNLPPGTYTVSGVDKVSNANCGDVSTYATQIVITQPTQVTGSYNNIIQPDCSDSYNGSVTATSVSGGSGKFNYRIFKENGASDILYAEYLNRTETSWTFTGLSPGDYYIQVKDFDRNNCDGYTSGLITINAAPALNLTTQILKNSTCFGANNGEIELTVSGGSRTQNYSFTLSSVSRGITYNNTSPNFSLVSTTSSEVKVKFTLLGSATDYVATVKNNDACNNVATRTALTITEPSQIVPTISQKKISCLGAGDGRLTVTNTTGGSGTYSYTWDRETSPGVWSLEATGLVADFLDVGNYRLRVRNTAAPSCEVTSATFTFANPPALSVAVTDFTHVVCKSAADATITASASGGWGNYSLQYAADGTNFSNLLPTSKFAPGSYTIRVTDDGGCTVKASEEVVITEPVVALSATFQKLNYVDDYNISCNGLTDGQVTITGIGGNGTPFSSGVYQFSVDGSAFQGNNVINGLSAGNHTINVRDQRGCVFTDVVSLKEPQALTLATLEKNYIKCFGDETGFIEVNAAGGLLPYTYSIDGGAFGNSFRFENLSAGNHEIRVRSKGGLCTTTLNESIDLPYNALQIAFTKTDVRCFGEGNGKLVATITGGAGGYNYVWTGRSETGNTIDNLIPASYNLKITDAEGCTLEKNETIAQPAAPLTAALKTKHIRCFTETNGTLEVIDVNGGTAPYNYSSNGGTTFQTPTLFPNLAKGDYTITVQDTKGCLFDVSASIIEPALLVPAVASKQDILCFGENTGKIVADATGGIAPYEFSIDGISFQEAISFDNLVKGDYVLEVKDSFGCVRTVATTLIQPLAPLSIDFTITPVQCKGDVNGEIETTIAGGTVPYVYDWGVLSDTDASVNTLATGNYTLTLTDNHNCVLVQDFFVPEPILALTASVSDQVNVSCNGLSDGTFAINTVGGYAPYTYSFEGGAYLQDSTFELLAKGNYAVLVKDTMGCVAFANTIITEPEPLAIAIDQSGNVSCFEGENGFIDLQVEGGTTPYIYSLDSIVYQPNPGFETLRAGQYRFVVQDANHCVATIQAEITQPALLVSAISDVINSSCNQQNGSALVSAAGGTLPYDFTWKQGVQIISKSSRPDLFAGFYQIVTKDALGCEATVTQAIIDEDGPSTSITASTDARCFDSADGQATVTASGGAGGYTYLWSDKANQTTATAIGFMRGDYVVTVTDVRGCKSISQITIGSPDQVDIETPVKTSPLCYESCDGSILINAKGGEGDYTFQWSNGVSGNFSEIENICRGTYTVKVIDKVGCTADFSINLSAPDSLVINEPMIKLPTCAAGSDGAATISVAGGTLPYQYRWNDPSLQSQAQANGLKEGVYQVVVTDEQGCVASREIVLDQVAPIVIDLGTSTTLCLGQSVTLDAGIDNATYVWKKDNNNFSSQKIVTLRESGVYTLDLTDAKGCKGYDEFTVVTSTRAFDANFLGASELVVGDSLLLVDVSFPSPDLIEWEFDEGFKMLISSADQPQITYLEPGEYWITMTAHLAECTDVMKKKVSYYPVEERNDINRRIALGESGFRNVKLYPNPTTGRISIEIEMHRELPVALLIYDVRGNQIYDAVDRNKLFYRFTPDLSAEENGVYLARIVTDGAKKDIRILLTR